MKIGEKLSKPWILCTDGSSCADGSGVGLILTSSEGMEFTYALRFGFEATNNEAEYEALIAGGILPAEADRARAVKRKSQRYSIVNGILYKKYFLGPWLRFGLPGEIISDNGKQFWDNPFKDWCEKLYIHQRFAFVKHPQTNGLVERANRSLGEGIKARLEAKSKNWMEEISHVLWAHRTMLKSSNGDTPFLLTYGTEAVIPAKIGMPMLRTAKVDVVRNDEALEVNLDLLEEKRE
ncbi:reverse transcriptase domain-containing protein [Tanacetum coccineum]